MKVKRFVRLLDSVVSSLHTYLKVPDSIPSSAVWFPSNRELFPGMQGLGVSAYHCRLSIFCSVACGGGPCTLLITGQWRPCNFACVLWPIENSFSRNDNNSCKGKVKEKKVSKARTNLKTDHWNYLLLILIKYL